MAERCGGVERRRWTARLRVLSCVGLVAVAGCAGGIRHPPTYADIASIDLSMESDPAEFVERSDEVRGALVFSPDDLAKLAASGDVSLLVGGVAGTPWQSETGSELLAEAEERAPDSPLVALTWIDRALVAGFDRPRDAARDKKLRRYLRLLHREMPENALPLYVAAYGKMRRGDTAGALKAMQVGRQLQVFDSGSRARFNALVAAAEAVGYSPFTARYHAMSLFVPTGTYSALRRMCSELIAGTEKHAARVECVLLGSFIEHASWNMLERAVGLSLQATAWENIKGPEGDAAREAINARWQGMKNRENLPSLRELSEQAWLEYFRIFVDSGEDAAMRYAASAASAS